MVCVRVRWHHVAEARARAEVRVQMRHDGVAGVECSAVHEHQLIGFRFAIPNDDRVACFAGVAHGQKLDFARHWHGVVAGRWPLD